MDFGCWQGVRGGGPHPFVMNNIMFYVPHQGMVFSSFGVKLGIDGVLFCHENCESSKCDHLPTTFPLPSHWVRHVT